MSPPESQTLDTLKMAIIDLIRALIGHFAGTNIGYMGILAEFHGQLPNNKAIMMIMSRKRQFGSSST